MITSAPRDRERLYELLPAALPRARRRAGRAAARPAADRRRAGRRSSRPDIRQLWDDLFIETCEPWVIPYIGDLVGTTRCSTRAASRAATPPRELFPDLAAPTSGRRSPSAPRADVAKTIYYRRRKGTLPMLEELARDVTGWAAHAVEFFELLGWNQMLEHLRLHEPRSPDIRRSSGWTGSTAPSTTSATPSTCARSPRHEGWHNIRNIGFFLWRLQRLSARECPGAASRGGRRAATTSARSATRRRCSARWRREGDEAGLATELHVPGADPAARFFETDLRELPRAARRAGLHRALRPVRACSAGARCRRPARKPRGLPQRRRRRPAFDPNAPTAPLSSRRSSAGGSTPGPPRSRSAGVIAVDVATGRLALGDGWGDADDASTSASTTASPPTSAAGPTSAAPGSCARPGIAPSAGSG